MGSVVSFLLYLWLLGRWTANRASLITLLTPLVALVVGFLWLGERLSALQTVGALLVLAGVALSLTSGRTTAPLLEPA
jgi:drug/metabolite transporter (DMT)-like permease